MHFIIIMKLQWELCIALRLNFNRYYIVFEKRHNGIFLCIKQLQFRGKCKRLFATFYDLRLRQNHLQEESFHDYEKTKAIRFEGKFFILLKLENICIYTYNENDFIIEPIFFFNLERY